jgi:two-component system LytT family sensor kinase
MNIFKRLANSELRWHILGIFTFVMLELKSLFSTFMSSSWFSITTLYIFNISFFYISAYFLIPMTKRKIPSRLLRLVCYAFYISVYACILFLPVFVLYRINHGTFRGWITEDDYSVLLYRSATFFIFAKILAMFLAEIKEKNDTIENERLLAETQRQNLEMENLLLRSQLNPHFINNGLSFIQTESNKTNPDMAGWVNSFAGVINYHMTTTNNGLVLLDDDLDQVQNYVYSQQGVLRDQVKIYFIRDIDERSGSTNIYPLLFMSLAENMFKHGRLKDADKTAFIIIRREDQWLIYHSENDIAKLNENAHSTGIGMSNTKRRLELLYPGQHILYTTIENNLFIVDLKICLWMK